MLRWIPNKGGVPLPLVDRTAAAARKRIGRGSRKARELSPNCCVLDSVVFHSQHHSHVLVECGLCSAHHVRFHTITLGIRPRLIAVTARRHHLFWSASPGRWCVHFVVELTSFCVSPSTFRKYLINGWLSSTNTVPRLPCRRHHRLRNEQNERQAVIDDLQQFLQSKTMMRMRWVFSIMSPL